ncbi:MAG: hypothetical protein ACP5KA_02050 [Desulfurococcaceae archaeon]
MAAPSESKFTINPRERDVVTVIFLVCLILFLAFVLSVALAERGYVEYARRVLGELPTYVVFTAIIVLLYLVGWAIGRAKSETVGIWYHG